MERNSVQTLNLAIIRLTQVPRWWGWMQTSHIEGTYSQNYPKVSSIAKHKTFFLPRMLIAEYNSTSTQDHYASIYHTKENYVQARTPGGGGGGVGGLGGSNTPPPPPPLAEFLLLLLLVREVDKWFVNYTLYVAGKRYTALFQSQCIVLVNGENQKFRYWGLFIELYEFKKPCEFFCLKPSIFWENCIKLKFSGCPRKFCYRVIYIALSSGHISLNFYMHFKLILRRCEVVSDVWSENAALFERLMEIQSNPPILYYGFNSWSQFCYLKVVWKLLQVFLSETINFLRKLHKTKIFGMPPKILP